MNEQMYLKDIPFTLSQKEKSKGEINDYPI